MPHIHTEPDQHDMTASAYIVMKENGEWKCLVHFHKKVEKLMQVGGHIELNETPWQTIAHELEEESGYGLDELEVLQHTADRVRSSRNILHPVPVLMNTHNVGDEHFHSDLCFGFVAKGRPTRHVQEGESADLRWLTIDELDAQVKKSLALEDVADMYRFLLDRLETYVRVPATSFSLEKPLDAGLVYLRGSAGEARPSA